MSDSMTGHRSNNFNSDSQETTLDTLSRTIEDLEEKILGRSQSGAPQTHVPPHVPPQSQGHSYASSDPSMGDQIRARQQSLSGRDNRTPSMAPSAQAGQHSAPHFQLNRTVAQPTQRATQSASIPPQPQMATAAGPSPHEISAILGQLRQELKQDMKSTLHSELGHIQSEMSALRSSATEPNVPASIGADLEQIAFSLKQLETQTPPEATVVAGGELDSLRLEVDSLRTLVDTVAKQETLIGLENRWGAIEDTLSGFDPNVMHGELANLAMRLEDIRHVMSTMPQSHAALGPLEDKVEMITNALAELINRPQQLDQSSQFVELTNQTDARLSQLAQQMEALSQRSDQGMGDHGLGERIESISSRLNDLAEDRSLSALEERISNLQSSLVISPTMAHSPQLDERLVELVNKVDALDNRAASVESTGIDKLVLQLSEVAQRFEEKQASTDNPGIDRLEHQLAAIADRLDKTPTATGDVNYQGLDVPIAQLTKIAQRFEEKPQGSVELPGLDRLEHQLTAIAERLEHSGDGSSTQFNTDSLQEQIAQLSERISGTNVDNVSETLANLQEHLNTNDEYVLEAARQAAEATLEAYNNSSHGASVAVPAHDNQMMTALTSDLKELENLYRSSDNRSAQAFEAVQQTLMKIADRLEHMSVAAPVAQPQMPHAEPLNVQDRRPSVNPPVRDMQAEAQAAAAAQYRQPIDHAQEDHTQDHHGDLSEEKPARGASSLLAGLAGKIKRDRAAPVEQEAPLQETYAQPVSALDELESEFADEPLEPGSGAPDINSIMKKVRDVQRARANQPNPETDGSAPRAEQNDNIASARRAALTAAAEVGAVPADEPKSKKRKRNRGQNLDRPEGETGKSLVREPVLIAAGVILLAMLAIPLANTFIGSDEVVSEPQVTEAVPQTDNIDGTGLNRFDSGGTDNAALPNELSMSKDMNETGTISEFGPRVIDTKSDDWLADELEVPNPLLSEDDSATDAINEFDVSLYAEAATLGDAIAPIALKQAALTGDPIALYEIGSRFTEGRGTPVILDKATKWLKLSADQNFAPAQYRLGNFYEKGTGVNRDIEKAKGLYEAAADNGNINAMHNLGVLYASNGTVGDFSKAAEWFLAAAEHGVRDSQVNMAILYARGEGIPRDLVKSYKWFAIAANEGDTDAALKRDEVFNALPEDQGVIARQKAESWTVTTPDLIANNVQIPDSWIGKGTNTASIDMKKAIKNIQGILNNNGFDAGKPDGVIGEKTKTAIKGFQASIGMKPDGEITDKLVQELLKRNG
jgi:localization factor PodJL